MNLFVKNPTFEKVGFNIFLSKDYSQWVKTIITNFLEEYPFLQNQALTVHWKKKEIGKGYAVGNLNIMQASVPIIVREWQLAPMDVIISGGRALPLTKTILQELMFNPEPFRGIATAQSKSNLAIFGDIATLQHSPINEYTSGDGTQSSERDAVKVSEFIEKISSVDSTAVKEVLEVIKNDPGIKQAFNRNTNAKEILLKLAEKETFDPGNTSEDFLRNLKIDRQLVYQDKLGNTIIKQANSKIDHTWKITATTEEADTLESMKTASSPGSSSDEKLVKKGNAYNVFNNGDDCKFYINEDSNWHLFREGEINKIAENVELNGSQPVIGEKGIWKLGNVVTMPFEIVDISKYASEAVNIYRVDDDRYLIFKEDGSYNYSSDQDSIKTASVAFEPEGHEPSIGDYGVMVLNKVATAPFEIIAMQKDVTLPGSWEITGFDGLRKVAYYPIKMKQSEFIKKAEGSWYIPGEAQFVKLSDELPKNKQNWQMLKTASAKGVVRVDGYDGLKKVSFFLDRSEAEVFESTRDGVIVPSNASFVKIGEAANVIFDVVSYNNSRHSMIKDDVGLYSFSGPEFDKYAKNGHEIRDLGANDAKWVMIHCNSNEKDLKKLAGTKIGRKTTLNSNFRAPRPISSVIDDINDKYGSITEKLGKLTINLIKEAAVLPDKSTIDAILSLGLLRKHNVAEYLELLPAYEKVMSELARLLISVRLGLQAIDEYAVKRAMDSLADVVVMLNQVAAVLKEKK